MKYKHLIYFLLLGLLLDGCKKEDSLEINSQISGVKIYSEITAGTENPSIKISVGKDRLYMTSGSSTIFGFFVNGLAYLPTAQIKINLLCSDLDGNLLWSNELPKKGLTTSRLVELNDGSSIVVGTNNSGFVQGINPKNIYIFRYNSSGEQLSVDSLYLPSDLQVNYNSFISLDILSRENGNILMYGTVSDETTYNSISFAVEYDVNNGIQWGKRITINEFSSSVLYSCVPTKDGGYIFYGHLAANSITGSAYSSKAFLAKTDVNCDTTWTRWYDYFNFQVPYPGVSLYSNVIETSSGGFCFSATEFSDDSYENYRSKIYEVDNKGDSISAVTLQPSSTTFCPLLMNVNSNTIHAFVYDRVVPFAEPLNDGVFTQINSETYVFGNKLKLLSKAPIQNFRGDLILDACKLPNGKIAQYGIFNNQKKTGYNPGIIFIK